MTRHSLLVLGGARSGKSRYAQERAEQTGLRCVFIATAQAFDEEMAERIACHRDERGETWETTEAPLHLAEAIGTSTGPDTVVLVDCLTLWASNLMLADEDIEAATDALTGAIAQATGPVILVANEVGMGIVPDNALARRFRDVAGRINQQVAACASEVQLLVAGLPLTIKAATAR